MMEGLLSRDGVIIGGRRPNKRHPIRLSATETITVQEFYMLIYDYMRPCIDCADAGGCFDWSRLEQAKVQFERYLRNKVLKYMFILFAFALFEEYRPVSTVDIEQYIHDFITTGLLTLYTLSFMFPSLVCEEHVDYDRSKVRGLMSSRHDCPDTCWPSDPLLRAYLTADLFAAKTLIRYGLVFNLPKNSSCEHNFSFSTLLHLGVFDLAVFCDWPTFCKVLRVDYRTEYSKRRLFLVIRAVNVLVEMVRRNEYFMLYAHILDLLFRTTPEPYIAMCEIRRIFELVTKGKMASRVNYLLNRYQECFRRTGPLLQPRSLRHLCRCQIRDSLRRARSLPHGVWSLDIPFALKHYVLLQKRDRDHHCCYFDNHVNRTLDHFPLLYGEFVCDLSQFYTDRFLGVP